MSLLLFWISPFACSCVVFQTSAMDRSLLAPLSSKDWPRCRAREGMISQGVGLYNYTIMFLIPRAAQETSTGTIGTVDRYSGSFRGQEDAGDSFY